MEQNIIVVESSRNLRALGRNALAGEWGLAVFGTLLFFVLTSVPAMILDAIFNGDNLGGPGISTLYSLLISGPMTLGYAMFAMSIFRRRETSAAEVFYGFERFGKAFGLYLVMSIFIFLWTLLLIVPGIIAGFRYSMSFYILADHPEMGIMEALNESKRMMRGNKWKLFCLHLSFLGWAILSMFTFFIGFLWLLPYVEVSTIAFYDIANGSLRSVRAIDREGGFSGAGGNEAGPVPSVSPEGPVIRELETSAWENPAPAAEDQDSAAERPEAPGTLETTGPESMPENQEMPEAADQEPVSENPEGKDRE